MHSGSPTLTKLLSIAVVTMAFGHCWHCYSQSPITMSPPDNGVTRTDITGLPADTTSEGDMEKVDLTSGSLNSFIPAVSLKQRGGWSLPIGFVYSNNMYMPILNISTQTSSYINFNPYAVPENEDYDIINYQATVGPTDPFIGSGGNAPFHANIPHLTASMEYYDDMVHGCGVGCWTIDEIYCLTNWTFTDWSGTAHTFIDPVVSGNMPLADCHNIGSQIEGTSIWTGTSVEGLAYSIDASNHSDVTITGPDGVVYHFGPYNGLMANSQVEGYFIAVPTQIAEPNGGVITLAATSAGYTITDTVGHQVTIGPGLTSISYTDSNGVAQSVTVSAADVSSLGLQNSGQVGFPDYSCNYTGVETGQPPPATQYSFSPSLVPQWTAAVTGSQITYSSSQRKYVIAVDQNERLLYIGYPSGGYSRYDWQSAGWSRGSSMVSCTWDYSQVAHRYECPNANGQCSHADEQITTYTPLNALPPGYNGGYSVEAGLNQEMIVHDADKTVLHGFAMAGSFSPSEVLTTVTSSSGNLLRMTNNTYSGGALAASSVTFNDVIGGTPQTYKTTYQWDSAGGYVLIDQPTEIDSYDFGATSPFKKVTQQWTHIGHIYNRLGSSTITDPVSGATQAKSYSYDGSGNETSYTQQGNDTPAYTIQFQNLDAYGQPQRAVDAVGNITTFSYVNNWADSNCTSDALGDAYLTSVSDALGDTSIYSYNSCTGTVASITDPNNQTTSFGYDSLNRATSKCTPDTRGQLWAGGICTQNVASTSVNYTDTAPNSVTTYELQSAQSTPVRSQTIFDGMGRKQSALKFDPYGTIETDTAYDYLGRVSSVTNPYRSTSDTTYGLTHYRYDALDRPISVTHPDGSRLTTLYSGSSTKVSDEGNGSTPISKVSILDSLGRLTSVCEVSGALQVGTTPSPDACNNAWNVNGFLTMYSYDAFGDLTLVQQNGLQNRTFHYDGLSRLVSSTNPEAQTTTYHYVQTGGSLCSGSSSALCSVTDANGTTKSYSYDNLNRILSKTYTIGSGAGSTPSVGYIYQAGTGIAANNANGRIVQEYTGSQSAPITQRTITQYDPLGRPQQETQCFLSNCATGGYSIAYTYDWMGNITSSTNGVSNPGILLTYQYDAANRLNKLSSSWDDAQHPSTLFQASQPLNVPGGVMQTGLNMVAPYGPYGLMAAQLSVNSQTEQASMTMLRTYDIRGRLNSETDQGQTQANASTTLSHGSITIEGREQASQAVAVTITGAEQSAQVQLPGLSPFTTYDYGDIFITVDGLSYTALWEYDDTPDSIATKIAEVINADSNAVVVAQPSGNVVSISPKAGVQAKSVISASIDNAGFNILYNFTPASFNVAVSALSTAPSGSAQYADAGTITITINGTTSATAWGDHATSACIANALGSAIQTSAGSFLGAVVNGPSIDLESLTGGAGSNWPMQVQLLDTAGFNPASFQVTASGMSGGATQGVPTAQGGVIYSYSIPDGGFAPDGNMLSFTDSVMGQWNFQYDSLNRLQAGSSSSGPYQGMNIAWAYDRFGNRWNEAFSSVPTGITLPSTALQYSNGDNRITSSSIGSTTYYSNGETQTDGTGAYIYDAEGRICYSINYWGAMTEYIYDAEGNRVAKGTVTAPSCDNTSNGFVLNKGYVLDSANHQMTETDGSGAWVHTNAFANGSLLATYSTHTTHPLTFSFNDWLGTKRADVSSNGSLCGTTQNLPFGNGQVPNGSCTEETEQHFTGKERDTESGLDYFGARYYGSSMGRWMSPDPKIPTKKFLFNPQKWNKYDYVLNNPLVLFDPDGQEEMWVQVRAFIPQKTVGRVMGDNRSFSTQENASSRASITMHIETDPAKNNGNPLLGYTQWVSDTHNVNGTPTSPIEDEPPFASAVQDKETGEVKLYVSMDVRSGDAWATPALGIRSVLDITVNEAGTNATVNGDVSASPAFEINFAPQGGPTTNLPIQGANSNAIVFLWDLGRTNDVNKQTSIQQPPQDQNKQ